MSGLRREFLWYNLIGLKFQVKFQLIGTPEGKKTRKIYFDLPLWLNFAGEPFLSGNPSSYVVNSHCPLGGLTHSWACVVVRRYFCAFTGVGAPVFLFLAGCRYLVKDGPMW